MREDPKPCPPICLLTCQCGAAAAGPERFHVQAMQSAACVGSGLFDEILAPAERLLSFPCTWRSPDVVTSLHMQLLISLSFKKLAKKLL